jgi:formylglycine-generating enzyme required for sulfatase activity
MAGVPGGAFVMGLDRKGQKDEEPAHAVTLAPFLLDRTEVTNAAYFKCVEAGACAKHSVASAEANHFGSDEKFRTPRRPISAVSHSDAETFCKWAGKRLPTEAEWERAARGSDGRLWPWGNERPTREHAVFGASLTEEVGSRPKGAGPYGHLDLAGNVWEWVADMYDPFAYKREGAARGEPGTCEQIMAALKELKHGNMQGYTGSNPIPDECEHVLRGGAFNYDAFGLRASNRVHHPGRFKLVMSGLRCARDWPDGPVEQAPPAASVPRPAGSGPRAEPSGRPLPAPGKPKKKRE